MGSKRRTDEGDGSQNNAIRENESGMLPSKKRSDDACEIYCVLLKSQIQMEQLVWNAWVEKYMESVLSAFSHMTFCHNQNKYVSDSDN